eukprot:943813_1
MTKQDEPNGLSSLYGDVLVHCLEFMDIRDMLTMSRLSKGMYKVVHITFQNVTLIRRTQLPKFVEATNGLLELVQAAKFPRLREFQLQFNLTVREFNMLLTHCPRLAIIRISPEIEEYPVSPAVPAEAFTGLTSPLVNLKCLS